MRTPRFGMALVVGLAIIGLAATSAQAADAGKKSVTFAKDIAPLLQQRCQACHHPGTVAPMSLMTYNEVRPWARSIKNRVTAREMPPWHIDRTVGIQTFKDDPSLSDEQIDMIVRWVDSGAPLGNPKDLPTPLTFNDEDLWLLGKPDMIIALPKEHVMYPNGPDWLGSYETDSGLTEDRYIKALQMGISKEGRRIVHHAIATVVKTDEQRYRDRRAREERLVGDSESRSSQDPVFDPEDGTYLTEYALGKSGEIFPEGTGRFLPKGARVNFNMHYHAIGEEVRDWTSVGITFYPKGYVPKHAISDLTLREMDRVDIAPGEMARSDVYYRLPTAAVVTAYQPHMHMRGKAMCMEAIHLNGSREMFSCTDRFDFNWHIMYQYDDDHAPLLPAGTVLHLVGIHDNTPTNPKNPDPTQWVGWGQRSVDEMTAAHISFEFLKDEDYKRLVAERQAKRQNVSTSQQQ